MTTEIQRGIGPGSGNVITGTGPVEAKLRCLLATTDPAFVLSDFQSLFLCFGGLCIIQQSIFRPK